MKIKTVCQTFSLIAQVELTFTPDALRAIAKQALDRKTGARGLRAIIENILLEPMFEIPGSDVTCVHITADVVNGLYSPIYTRIHDSVSDAPQDPKSGNSHDSSRKEDEEIVEEVKQRV